LKSDKRYPQFALRLTADKKEITDFPQLPSTTSFIRQTLGEMTAINRRRQKNAN